MGTVLSSKMKDPSKIIFEVSLDYDEAIQLRGHMDNVHLFSENINQYKTNIAQRGKKEATKYFLIPRELRLNMNFENNNEVLCQKIETKNKIFFIYTVDKVE